MAMTPQKIQEKHFHDSFRGYSHEEVDVFLDEIAESFERTYRENQTLQKRVSELEQQLKQAAAQPKPAVRSDRDESVSEGTLKRMLVIAQETADKAVQEARAKAQATLQRSESRARDLEEQAKSRADDMVAQAESKLRDLNAATVEKRQELEQAKEALTKFEQEYRVRFRHFIESQLEALNDFSLTPTPGLARLSSPLAVPDPTGPASPERHGPDDTVAAPLGDWASKPNAIGDSEGAAEPGEAKESTPAPSADSGQGQGSEEAGSGDKAKADTEDDRLIRELFWGEE